MSGNFDYSVFRNTAATASPSSFEARRAKRPKSGYSISTYRAHAGVSVSGHPERMAITQPRVVRNELPWAGMSQAYPERVGADPPCPPSLADPTLAGLLHSAPTYLLFLCTIFYFAPAHSQFADFVSLFTTAKKSARACRQEFQNIPACAPKICRKHPPLPRHTRVAATAAAEPPPRFHVLHVPPVNNQPPQSC